MEKLKRMFLARAVMTLLLTMLTTGGAWADGGVDYIDANGVLKNTLTDGIDGNDAPTVISSSNLPTSLSAG